MTDQLSRSMQIHDCSLEQKYANTWPLIWTVLYKYMTDHLNVVYKYMILRFKWSVLYLHTAIQVSGDIFVFYGSSDQSCIFILLSSDQSCICMLQFKWSVMYLYTTFKWSVMYLYSTVQMSGHVFAYFCSSEQSCICILRLNWSVMYFYTTIQVISHVFVYYCSSGQSYTNTWPLTWIVVCKYITDHLNSSIKRH
jgi:hypothetical protein